MKAHWSLIIASLTLLAGSAFAEKAPPHRATNSAPRAARARPPNTTAPTPTTSAYQAITKNEKVKPVAPSEPPRARDATTGLKYETEVTDLKTGPDPTQHAVQGNKIGVDAAQTNGITPKWDGPDIDASKSKQLPPNAGSPARSINAEQSANPTQTPPALKYEDITTDGGGWSN